MASIRCNYGFCNLMFHTTQELMVHSLKHNYVGKYRCLGCNYTSNKKDKFRTHLKAHAPHHTTRDAKPNHNFKASNNHQRGYNKVRPYICPYDNCAYKGTSLAALRNHVVQIHNDSFSIKDYRAIILLTTLKHAPRSQKEIVVNVEDEEEEIMVNVEEDIMVDVENFEGEEDIIDLE